MEVSFKRWMVLASVITMTGGCSTLGIHWGQPAASTGRPPGGAMQVDAEAGQTPQESSALSSVADFLERTKAYDAFTQSSGQMGRDEVSSPISSFDEGALARVLSLQNEQRSSGLSDSQRGAVLPNTHMSLETRAVASAPTVAMPVVESVAVRLAAGTQRAEQRTTWQSLSNQGLDAAPVESERSLSAWLDELQSQVDKGEDFDAEWQLRFAHLALNHDMQATSVSANLRQPAGAILRSLLDVAIAARRTIRNPYAFAEDSLFAVERFKGALLGQADPVVTSVALCSKVVTFGVFDEMNPETFVAGRALHAIVYTEVANLQYEQVAEGLYRTLLGSRLELFTADGQSVWQKEEPEIEDLCRSRRNDFFVAQRVTFPPTMRNGDYVLKVAIEDKLSGRADEATYPFTVGLRSSVARAP